MKTMTIHITKSTLVKANKANRRNEMIESGFHNRPKNQTHKSVKDYSRKSKHKVDYSI
jgi:hypothetical protein